jgi:hypothetical protein
MTIFEPCFEALDGPQPYSSLELVAPDVAFLIPWAPGGDRNGSQFRGGLDELRGFIDAGDMAGRVHYVLWSRVDDGVEFASGRDALRTTAVSAPRRDCDGSLHLVGIRPEDVALASRVRRTEIVLADAYAILN